MTDRQIITFEGERYFRIGISGGSISFAKKIKNNIYRIERIDEKTGNRVEEGFYANPNTTPQQELDRIGDLINEIRSQKDYLMNKEIGLTDEGAN